MEKNEDFRLVGHLQVMDEPLSSLYIDKVSGLLYLFVRVFEDSDVSAFVLTVVSPLQAVYYMEGRVGLQGIFSNGKSYYYRHINNVVRSSCFELLPPEKVSGKLESCGLGDKFDSRLSYRTVPLKQHLKRMIFK